MQRGACVGLGGVVNDEIGHLRRMCRHTAHDPALYHRYRAQLEEAEARYRWSELFTNEIGPA